MEIQPKSLSLSRSFIKRTSANFTLINVCRLYERRSLDAFDNSLHSECYRPLCGAFYAVSLELKVHDRFFCLALTLLSPLLCSEYEPNCWSTRAKWRHSRRCIKIPLMLYHGHESRRLYCSAGRRLCEPEILLLAGYANRARARCERRTRSEWKIHLYDRNGEESEREWTNKDWTEAMLIKAVGSGYYRWYFYDVSYHYRWGLPLRYRVAFDRRSSTMRIIRWVYEIHSRSLYYMISNSMLKVPL